MKKELYISTRGDTHAIAVTEGGKLVEFNSESQKDLSIVGNIYRGKIEQIVLGMEAVFINIGRKKNGYLYLGETTVLDEGSESKKPSKFDLAQLKVGDNIMVQVSKSEIGTKGARLTANISISGRFLVYMPEVDYIGISRKIVDECERQRLIDVVTNFKGRVGGFIIRTACEFASVKEIEEEAKKLMSNFASISKAYENTKETEACYIEGDILYRAVKDIASGDLERITVDDENTFLRIRELLERENLGTNSLSLFSNQSSDLFNFYGLSQEVLRVLDSKVELDNGAYLIIENTEALTVIDVNTGRFVGSTNLEETVFETNMLATKAIAAQIRLRGIGGIIIVDFIDMLKEEHKQKVLENLSECVKRDRVRTSVIGMTPLGLVEITRKKSKNEIKQKMSKTCATCGGKGYVMTSGAMTHSIKSKLFKLFSDKNVTGCKILVSSVNVHEFFEGRAFTFEISVFWQNKRIYVVPDESQSVDSFKIQPFYEDVFEIDENAKLLY